MSEEPIFEEKEPGNISRRSIILSATIVPVAAIRSAAQRNASSSEKISALTTDQFNLLDAFADRLIPADDNGPGASQCGAANYIDRALAGALSGERSAFVDGLEAVNAFAIQSQGKAFTDLTADAKDAILAAMDNGTATGFTPNSRIFFARIRRLTLEGTFGDPFYGGNKGFAGWDLIGYPGPRLAVSADEQRMRVTLKPVHASAWASGKDGH